MDHEDRLDEIGSRQLVFPDELPQGSRTPPTARPVGRREGHIRRLERGETTRNLKWRPGASLARALPSFDPEPVSRLSRSY